MLTSNSNPKLSISDIEVEELSNDAAATIQGGRVELYRHHARHPKNERLGVFNGGGLRRLSSNANNQISAIRISAGGGTWRFYDFPNWLPGGSGGTWTIRAPRSGTAWYNVPARLNDKISSFRRIG
jgi:hypothetical protein